jgi:2-amino-4-hydroxy-6-hydroxymethyldihydropteridine diphosphokinase
MLKSRLYAPNKIYKYYLSLGSNVSPRISHMRDAIIALEKIGTVIRKSSLYKSEPWGRKDQPLFLNAIILFHTLYSPFKLLRTIKQIEKKLGRTKSVKWGPRRIDIDIIFCDNFNIAHKELNIPHLRYKERKFVLVPMMELDKLYCVDGASTTVESVFNSCKDRSSIETVTSSW